MRVIATNNKKIISILCIIAMLLCFFGVDRYGLFARAYEPKPATVNGINVNVRTSPVSGSSICKLNTGHELTIVNEANGSDGYVWYNVDFTYETNSKNGWIRSDYVRKSTETTAEVTDQEFEAKLDEQGFSESYKSYLRTLHVTHPNWSFKALHTGIKWEDAIDGQIAITSRNLIPASSVNSWKSLAPGAYDWNNNKWYEYERGWVAASEELIRYYMDPRNFLVDDTRILMFMSLDWTGTETKEGINRILAGTAMGNSGEDFASYFYEAGQTHNISAYHLAARAKQETAGGKSGSVTGQYKNYFNIGATGSDPVAAAVEYAKSKGWDTAKKSILGGAGFVANSYVRVGQNSLYLQKFDVVDGGNGFYWHQYMGNVLAPESESKFLAQAFDNLNTSTIVFTIPVFEEMPENPAILPSSNGNPNNLLESLSVDGYSLTPSFNKFKDSYDVIVSEDTTSVNVSATAVLDSSSVSGTGTVTLNDSSVTTVIITVTPTYGNSRKYALNIAKGNVAPNPPASISYGDINNDGNRNVVDLVMMKKHIVGISTLSGEQFTRGDINHDGVINVVDLVLLKKHIVGLQIIS